MGELVPMEDRELAGDLATALPPPSERANSDYDPRIAAAVCWRVAQGETLKGACKAEGVVLSVFHYWLLKLLEVEKMYRAARRLAAMSHFDTLSEQVKELIERKTSATGTEVRATDVAMTALARMAEVLNPAEFGPRQLVGGGGVIVRIETTLNLSPSANNMQPPRTTNDVYTHAQQNMGTVVEVPTEMMVNGRGEPDASKGLKGARANEVKTFTREVKGGDQEGVRVGPEGKAAAG